jgi:prepilin-type N-terminal cleavage/methylation domain-containing protein
MEDTFNPAKDCRRHGERGFTLLETTIALLLMAIVGLGAASLFFYSVKNTETAGDRELAMAVAQQQMEELRNADFASADLAATAGTTVTLTSAGRSYTVLTVITDSNVVSGQATTKTITVRATPNADSSTWARNITSVFGSVTLVTQRTAVTMGPNRAL